MICCFGGSSRGCSEETRDLQWGRVIECGLFRGMIWESVEGV